MTRIRWMTGLILLLTFSGALLIVLPPRAVWHTTLLLTLIHLLLSVLLVVMAGPILYRHIRRNIKRQGNNIANWWGVVLLVLVIATGCWLTIEGQRGRLALAHTIIGLCFFAVFFAHSGLTHIKLMMRGMLRLLVISAFVVLIYALITGTRSTHSTASPEAKLFSPASMQILGELPAFNEDILGAKRCAECHKQIVDQWKESMHAMADTELFYARVVGEFRKEYGFEASNWCAGCHSPLRLGRGELNEKVAIVAQPNVDCVICHSIRSVREPLGNNNYDLSIARPSGYELAKMPKLSDQMLLLQPDAHRALWNGPFMRSPEFCGGCHRQVLPDFLSEGHNIVIQDTYQEWAESKYNSSDKTLRRTCQDCHMPVKPGLGENLGKHQASHLFLGVSIDIARISGAHTSYAEGKRFLENAATLTVTSPDVTNEIAEVSVKVTNSGAGHDMPTGVSDLRQMWIELTATNEANEVIYESGKLDANGYLDPSAAVFGTTFGDGKGNPVHFHHIARVREVISDTAIPAGETREIKYNVPILNSKKLLVEVKLMYRAVPQGFINHYMTPDLRSEIVVMSKASTTIKVMP